MAEQRTLAFFGPGGNSESFHREKQKNVNAPLWVQSKGLDAYEYEAGRGIATSDEVLLEIGKQARECGVHMSFHAPYFISLSGVVPETRLKSISYIAESVRAARLLGAQTIVVHTGSAAKITREEAMALAADTLYRTLEELDLDGVFIGLETMGKINQLGTLEEVISLCKLDSRLRPVVDFGHINARELGNYFKAEDNYRNAFDRIATELGDDIAKNLHCHFSKIEWTNAGEKKHLTFEDTVFGPDFEPLLSVLEKDGLTPTIICESAGTQAEDALTMKKHYLSLMGL
ncbi:MAG: TIM barrel protein [Clostridia bacterium]|nr:TIM barrel protein [Clostridia bacterium]